ncbi:ArsR/SmtB family transcription factor [Rubellicoccus peritrichatus]|uniref:ArsR/SmtB family transcription factor n=1 Tax=Rubellicoccus peritrichatus TaxID=3080537 RepID=UPI003CE50C22
MNEAKGAQFGKALGDVTRQRILRYCCCSRKSVGEIAENVQVTQPTASHHLAILEEAGLTRRFQEGKMVYYEVNQEAIVNCCGQLLLRIAPDQKEAHQICNCCS